MVNKFFPVSALRQKDIYIASALYKHAYIYLSWGDFPDEELPYIVRCRRPISYHLMWIFNKSRKIKRWVKNGHKKSRCSTLKLYYTITYNVSSVRSLLRKFWSRSMIFPSTDRTSVYYNVFLVLTVKSRAREKHIFFSGPFINVWLKIVFSYVLQIGRGWEAIFCAWRK